MHTLVKGLVVLSLAFISVLYILYSRIGSGTEVIHHSLTIYKTTPKNSDFLTESSTTESASALNTKEINPDSKNFQKNLNFAIQTENQQEINLSQTYTEHTSNTIEGKNEKPKIGSESFKVSNKAGQASTVIEKNPSSECFVRNYEFSADEEKQIFGYKTYEKCQVPTNDEISYENGELNVKCENSTNPLFFTEYMKNQKYGGSILKSPRWKKTFSDLQEKEFVMVKCSEKAIYTLVFNRFSKEKSQTANEIRNKLEPSKKNMNVFVLVFDSVSRYSVERNLPLTLKFLTDFQNSQFSQMFSVYDFEKPAVPAPFTKYNLAQIIYGKSAEDIEKVVGGLKKSLTASSESHLEFQKNAIWSHYSRMGYVTMFLHDSVWDFIPPLTGRDILTDHVLTNIWRYIFGTYKWHNFSNSQRCVGNKNSHELSFEYSYQYFDNYDENNKFAYVHLDAAHENSGNIRVVDADLLKFLKKFLLMITNKEENLALFLMSDHGVKRVKDTQFDYRFYFEAMVPMTYLILSKEIENQWNIKETLIHNQNQLVSRFDINLSLKHISYFPYKISFDDVYSNLQSYYGLPGVVSLFKEKLVTTRACSDIGVIREYCLCNWYEKVEQNELEIAVQGFIKQLIREYIQSFHNDIYVCESFNYFDVISDYSFPLKTYEEGWDTLYKLELVTLKGFIIEVEANFCLESKILKTNKILTGIEHPYKIFQFNQQSILIQISKLKIDEKCKSDICDC